MKRKWISSGTLKQLFLAVPASALMLGAAHGGSSVGINFQGSYYGYYAGATVTATAFGLPSSDWFTDSGDLASGSMQVSPAGGGTLTVDWSSGNTWSSGLYPEIQLIDTNYIATNPVPGDAEVLWGYLDDTSGGSQVTVSGLSSAFPNGYVVQTMGAEVYSPVTFANSIVQDGVTSNALAYTDYWLAQNFFGPPFNGKGTAGLSAQSDVFTSDSITVLGGTRQGGVRAPLCGFILTDKPVVSRSPSDSTNDWGSDFTLSVGAIGIPSLSYQWRHDGTNISGATSMSYTNLSATTEDAGAYDVVVTNLYGSATSAVANVTILLKPSIVVDLPSSITNYATMNASFAVVAGGAKPLDYSWVKDGESLGVTTPSITITNLQSGDNGGYQLIVTNSYGSVTSSVAQLTVLSSAPPYEGFDYPAGSLTGQGTGTGWVGNWTQEAGYNGDHAVVTPVQPWRGNISELVSTGGGVALGANGSADFDDIRDLQATLGGNGYGTVYMSFVCLVTNAGWGGIELVQDGNASLFLGSCWYYSHWGWGTRAAPDATTPVPASTLALLVYRFDFTPTNTMVRLYANPSALSAEPATADASGSEDPFTFNQIRIVTHNDNPNGFFDEFRIGGTWASVTPHTIRTDAPFAVQIVPGGVIADTKPVGTPHPGLTRGTSWLDSSTDYNTVTRTGVQQFSAGNQGQITVAPDPDFNTTSGTICFWMQFLAPITGFPGPGNEGAMLFDRRTSSGTVIVLNQSGYIQFQAAGGPRFTSSQFYVTDGNWHHVAVTYDQSTNGAASVYVDGMLDTAVSNPGAWSWPTNQEIELGRSHDSWWYIYDGQMDDVRIYNRMLTPAEITTIATPATSDELVDTNALVLRYNFDVGVVGQSVTWPYGILQSSPALGPAAVWTDVPNAVSPMPFLPTDPVNFYRLIGTP